jgi:hypothetical protein
MRRARRPARAVAIERANAPLRRLGQSSVRHAPTRDPTFTLGSRTVGSLEGLTQRRRSPVIPARQTSGPQFLVPSWPRRRPPKQADFLSIDGRVSRCFDLAAIRALPVPKHGGSQMAIVACKECKGQVSSKAVTCPHFGAKVGLDRWDRHYRNSARFAVFIGLVFGAAAIWVLSNIGP